uniref:DUF4783 domain-containing protein n=1 Tax=Caenorhabditis tropicalis TaxID=1561998 RepID=A0A1I7UKP0_9PELO
MHLFTFTILTLLAVSASATDPDAVEVAHNFFKQFMNAIKSGDLFKVLPLISVQPGYTNVDASKLIQELKGYRISFRGAKFLEDRNQIEVSAIFRAPGTEKASKSAIFVIESNSGAWTIKSMSDIVNESGAKKNFIPPMVMG